MVEAHRCITGRERARADVLPTCVLDLGCGTGLATRAWLDRSNSQGSLVLTRCCWWIRSRRHGRTGSRCGGGASWGESGVVLDAFQPDGHWCLGAQLPPHGSRLLLSSYALQWSPTPLTVLQRVWAPLLRAGDWLAVAVPDAGSFQVLRRALAAAELPSHLLMLPDQHPCWGRRLSVLWRPSSTGSACRFVCYRGAGAVGSGLSAPFRPDRCSATAFPLFPQPVGAFAAAAWISNSVLELLSSIITPPGCCCVALIALRRRAVIRCPGPGGSCCRPQPKPACTARSAATPSLSATTQLVRISLVAISSMFRPGSASVRNMRAAVPAVAGMPAPTALTRAIAGPSSSWAPGHCASSGARA